MSIFRRPAAKTRIDRDCLFRKGEKPRHTRLDPLVQNGLASIGEGAPDRERRIFICLSPPRPRQ
jgi:hypothetical protein